MASSWTPSSPRPNFRPAAYSPTADISLKNYTWYREQFERVIVGYLKDKNEEQFADRARAAIFKLSEDTARDGRFTCWNIIQAVMNRLVHGAPTVPHAIAYGRYIVKPHRIQEILDISNAKDFVRRLYRIVPMEYSRSNDFEFELLLWREGLGDRPASTGLGIPRTRATDGYANAPNQTTVPVQPRMVDKHTSTRGARASNTPAAPLTTTSQLPPARASSVDVKPDLSTLLKRPSVVMVAPSAKRQCRSERDANRLSPIQQEANGTTSTFKGESSRGTKNNPDTLSDHFTKLLEDQQKQNAKQSVRIAQLEDRIRVSEETVAEKDEEMQNYLGLDVRVKRLQSTIEARDDELKKSEHIITKQIETIKQKDELIKLQKAQRERAGIPLGGVKSDSELRRDDKTARLRHRLKALEERKPDLVCQTDAILDSLRAYMTLLEQGSKESEAYQDDIPDLMANGSAGGHISDHDSARVLEDGEIAASSS